MAIRYDKKLNQEINRTIKNFNQKIARLEKEERNLLLPSKITKKELTNSVYNRNELNKKLRELQRFSRRGIEETITTSGGYSISKYELTNIQIQNRVVKAQLTRELKRLQTTKPKVFGKEQSRSFAEMGDTEYLNLEARRKVLDKGKITNLTPDEFLRYRKLLDKTIQNKLYMNNVFKNNYVKMLTDLGYYYNYDSDKMKKLEQTIMKLNPNDFLKLFKNDKSIKAILDYYPTVTNTLTGINPDDIKEDVVNLYDTLIDNLDVIMQDYA